MKRAQRDVVCCAIVSDGQIPVQQPAEAKVALVSVGVVETELRTKQCRKLLQESQLYYCMIVMMAETFRRSGHRRESGRRKICTTCSWMSQPT